MQDVRVNGGVDDGDGGERPRPHRPDGLNHLGAVRDGQHGLARRAELPDGARQDAAELGAVRAQEPDHVHLREHPVDRRGLNQLHRHHVLRRALQRHQRAVHALAERLHAVQQACVWVERPQGEALQGVANDGGHRHGHAVVEVDGLRRRGRAIPDGGSIIIVAGLGDVGEDVEHVDHADVVLAGDAGGGVGLDDHGPAGADPVAGRRGHGDGRDAAGEERVGRVGQRGRVGDLHQPLLGARQLQHLALPEDAAEARARLLVALAAACAVLVAAVAVQGFLLLLLVAVRSHLRHCRSEGFLVVHCTSTGVRK